MAKVLENPKIGEKAKEICNSGQDIYLAVSYWSGGATEALGIRKDLKINVVLDVKSGGTSSLELEELIKRLGENVRVHTDLHAKIYATETLALVGSANASKPGLHLDGGGHAEAAVLLEQHEAPQAFDIARSLFNQGKPATKSDVEICRERFGRRPLGHAEAGNVRQLPFLASLQEQPELFEAIPFLFTEGDFSISRFESGLRELQHSIGTGIEAREFNRDNWDAIDEKLDPKYMNNLCLWLHIGARHTLTLSLGQPLFAYADDDGEATYVLLKPWTEILGLDGQEYQGKDSIRIEAGAADRAALIAAHRELMGTGFKLGADLIKEFRRQAETS